MGSINSIYLKAGGQFGPIKFINTCVPDSLLIGLYCCYVQHEHVASLFNSFEKLRAPMVFLRVEMYDAAKASWLYLSQFSVTKNTSERDKYVIDAWSEPGDHLHILNELIVSNDKLSKLKHLGNVHALGLGLCDLDPLLVLVDIHKGMNTVPTLHIEDDYYRPYELQFLLMSRRSFPLHMIVALNLFDRWVVYDNEKSSYVDFNPTQADFKGDFIIHNAGYVETQNGMFIDHFTLCVQLFSVHTFLKSIFFLFSQFIIIFFSLNSFKIFNNKQYDCLMYDFTFFLPVPIGVAEEGYRGTVPFNRGSQKEHID
ncbi:hypothetical protein PO909_010837 [Leuciscus waleckii]